MIVEHSFVTTLPAPDAFALAGSMLTARGFGPDGEPTSQSHQWRRGRSSVARAGSTLTLPQRIRMEFDRGRITIGAAVDLDRRRWKRAESLILAYACALEQALTARLDPAAAAAPVETLERRIRFREWLTFWIVASTVFLTVVGVGWGIWHISSL